MRGFFVSVAILLAASSAVAAGIPSNGVVPGPALGRRDVEKVSFEKRAACNADNVLRALRAPTRSVAASAFCSAFLQPTVTAVSTQTIPLNATVTRFTTISNFTTITATSTIPTNTALCPIASPSQVCGYPAYGYFTYLISQAQGVDPVVCHERCLQDPNCQSFQVQTGGSQFCNLYNAVTTGNVQYAPDDAFTFYDRGCPNFVPDGCSNAVARDIRKRTTPIPSYLATVPATRISSACSCLITSAAAANTTTLIIPYTSPSTVFTTVPVTVTITKTVLVSVNTTTHITV